MMVEKDAMVEEEIVPSKNVETCDTASLEFLFAAADHEWSSRLGDGQTMSEDFVMHFFSMRTYASMGFE